MKKTNSPRLRKTSSLLIFAPSFLLTVQFLQHRGGGLILHEAKYLALCNNLEIKEGQGLIFGRISYTLQTLAAQYYCSHDTNHLNHISQTRVHTSLRYSHGLEVILAQIFKVFNILSSAVSFSLKQLCVLIQLQSFQPGSDIFLHEIEIHHTFIHLSTIKEYLPL